MDAAAGAPVSAGRVFVGRESELAELRAALAAAAGGHGRLLLLVGEAGIGKTRLAEMLAADAGGHGMEVAWGRCWEGDGAPPYWPWMQILRVLLRSRGAGQLAAQLGAAAADLAGLAPELSAVVPGATAPAPLSGDQARFRLFDAATALLIGAASARPLLLIVDDLHWADPSSVLLLQFLARELRDAPLLVVGSYRDTDVRTRADLAPLLGELARDGRRLSLRGLSAGDVQRFIAGSSATAPAPALVAAVHQATDGNPFFVDEVVHLLAADGRLDAGVAPGALRIPDGVRAAIRRRLDPLPSATRALLAAAAVIGREFDVRVLQAAANGSAASTDDLIEALGDAVASGIVTAPGGTIGRYAFSHALIRETLYDDLPPAERLRLHRQVGTALERRDAGAAAPSAAELAHHFTLAAPLGDAAKGVECARRAAEHALRALAYEEAAHWYARALAVGEPVGLDAGERGALLLALANAAWRAGDWERAETVLQSALALARGEGDAAQLARLALALGTMRTERGLADQSLLAVLSEALAAVGDREPVLSVRLLARLGAAHRYVDPVRQRALSEQAVVRARATADGGALAAALQALHGALWEPDSSERRLELADEVVRLGEADGDRELVLEGRALRIFDLLEMGEAARADAEIDAYAREAEAIRQPRCRWAARIYRGMQALLQGRFAEAERLAESALVMRQASNNDPSQFYGAQLFIIRREQDRLGELEGTVERLVHHYPGLVAWRAALAFLYGEIGLVDEARRELDRLAARDFDDLPQDATWPPTAALLAEAIAALGDRPRAAPLYDRLLPFAGRTVVVVTGVACRGAIDHYLGLLAGTLGEADTAAMHFEAALVQHARMHAWPWLAHTQYQYAATLLACSSGRAARAAELLDQALQATETLGMPRLARLVRELSAGHERVRAAEAPRIAAMPAAATSQGDAGIATFRQEGGHWTIAFEGRIVRLKDTKGLRGLAFLLQHPEHEFPAIQLAELVGGAHPDLPPQGGKGSTDSRRGAAAAPPSPAATDRSAVEQRLRDLKEELEEAQEFNDLGRIDAAQQEIEELASTLVGALGLGTEAGDDNRAQAEQARINVTKVISLAVKKIAAEHRALGRYLESTVSTGRFCSYRPDPRAPIAWSF